ncbi:16368_t:CDS:2, partial [Racocetra fulgida]
LDTITNDRPLPTASPLATTLSTNQYFTSFFYDYSNDDSTDNELDKYMDIKIVPIALQDKQACLDSETVSQILFLKKKQSFN